MHFFFQFFRYFLQLTGRRSGFIAKLRAKNSENSNGPLANSTTMLKTTKVSDINICHWKCSQNLLAELARFVVRFVDW